MNKITHEELECFNMMIQKEQEILNKVISSNEDIGRASYNPEKKVLMIQFQTGKTISKEYLESLKTLIDYKSYVIATTQVTEEIFRIKYTEHRLQLNIYI